MPVVSIQALPALSPQSIYPGFSNSHSSKTVYIRNNPTIRMYHCSLIFLRDCCFDVKIKCVAFVPKLAKAMHHGDQAFLGNLMILVTQYAKSLQKALS